MKNVLGIASAVMLALSGAATAGTFSLTTTPAAGDNADVIIGSTTDVNIFFAGDGDTQDAQMDFSLSDFTNLTITANVLVPGSVCAFNGTNLLRVAPPSGAGTALTSTPTAYCSFSIQVAGGQAEEVRPISTSLLDCAPLGVGDTCVFTGNGINIVSTPPVMHTVTASAGAGGTATPATQDVVEGMTANVTVTPNGGFQVTSITGCGGVAAGLPSNAPVIYTTGAVNADCAVTASFGAIPFPAYSSNPAPGAIGCDGPPGSTASRTIVITNTGSAIMNIAGCAFSSGVDFSVATAPPATLAAGASAGVDIDCSVPAEGDPAVTDTLTCTHDAPNSPATYSFSSVAVTVPAAVPTPDLVPASSLWSKLMLFGFLAGLGALVISLRRS